MIIKIVAIGIVATVLAIVLRKEKPEFASAVGIIAGIVILTMLMDDIQAVLQSIKIASEKAGVEPRYIALLIKIIGISYITQFGSAIAKDAGEGAIASKIYLGGKIAILLLSALLLFALLNLIIGILP